MSGVGVSLSSEAGGSAGWGGNRGEQVRQILRDEVRRLNPPDGEDTAQEILRGEANGVMVTKARSPGDTSIRLSPEPRFLLIRHWSLYDSMLHSPYLAARLHIWSDTGRKRLHKLLAKMGVSLAQCKRNYTDMDMDLKHVLRQRLLRYAPLYGLDGLVPPAGSGYGPGREGWGFVRSWGWKACLSATDVGVIIGAILEVGKHARNGFDSTWDTTSRPRSKVNGEPRSESDEYITRFWAAYDALDPARIDTLKASLPIAQHLHRAILRTGTALIEKRQIRHLRAFRMAVVKDGPDVALFTHPGALTKLALWVGEAIIEQEKEGGRGKKGGTPLVLAGLDEGRGVYVVVGTGGGGGVVDLVGQRERKEARESKKKAKAEKQTAKEKRRAEREERRRIRQDDEDAADEPEEDEGSEEEEDAESEEDSDSEEDEEEDAKRYGRNRFGIAFQEVVDETNARVRIDSFEHCVVEVKKEDLSSFLESLSMKVVVG